MELQLRCPGRIAGKRIAESRKGPKRSGKRKELMNSETKITGNQVQITRLFNAPRPAVFAWWTRAENLQKWSGCKDATLCEIEMDFRVGGSFTQKMHIAGAGDFTI